MSSGRYDGAPPAGMYSVGYIATMEGVLEDARASLADAPLPTDDEIARFTRLLARIHTLGAKDGAIELRGAWGRAERVLGDRDARDLVLETLAMCGLLETPTHHGLTTRWTDHEARSASAER